LQTEAKADADRAGGVEQEDVLSSGVKAGPQIRDVETTHPSLIVRPVSSTEARSPSAKISERRRGGAAHVPILEQVRLLARVRGVSPRQFGAAFEHDAWSAYKRIQRLCEQGLADRARPLRDLPSVVWATPAGLAAVGLERSRPLRLSLDRLAHDLAFTELLLSLRRTAGGNVVTERELRRDQASSSVGLIRIAAGGGTGAAIARIS
jgi:hypothetical protein